MKVSDDSGNESEVPGEQADPDLDLIVRGLGLLSIMQLREFLSSYNLSTGGNKKALVNRLLLFIEAFRKKKTELYLQFSLRLKKLLSADEKRELKETTMSLFPPDITERVFSRTPSCLYQLSSHEWAFEPVMISDYPSEEFVFDITGSIPQHIPVFEIAPLLSSQTLFNVRVRITDQMVLLTQPMFWLPLSSYCGKSGLFTVEAVDPPTPIIVMIRWMCLRPIEDVMHDILNFKTVPMPTKKVIQRQNLSMGICPLTRKVLFRAVRGVTCNHMDCFDLSGFLAYGERTGHWRCPICGETLPPDSLAPDLRYFYSTMCE